MTVKRIPAPQSLLSEPDATGAKTLSHALTSAGQRTRRQRHRALNAEDGTDQLLVSGFWTMSAGLVAGLLAMYAFGGIGPQGAHSNAGWLSLMVAMMCTPFAVLLLLLGGAKWLRNLGLSKQPGDGAPR
jgi:hypothetical protein